jgi:hypothetical protein
MGKGRIRPRGSGQPYRQPVSVDPESQRPSVVVSSATASIDIDSPHHCGRPRLVTPLARARTAAAVSDEAAAEEWPSGDREPRAGDSDARRRSGKLSLELDEALVALWPCPGFRCHSAILTHGQQVGDAFGSYPWGGEG